MSGPFFVGGTGRCGTSQLTRVLGEHSPTCSCAARAKSGCRIDCACTCKSTVRQSSRVHHLPSSALIAPGRAPSYCCQSCSAKSAGRSGPGSATSYTPFWMATLSARILVTVPVPSVRRTHTQEYRRWPACLPVSGSPKPPSGWLAGNAGVPSLRLSHQVIVSSGSRPAYTDHPAQRAVNSGDAKPRPPRRSSRSGATMTARPGTRSRSITVGMRASRDRTLMTHRECA